MRITIPLIGIIVVVLLTAGTIAADDGSFGEVDNRAAVFNVKPSAVYSAAVGEAIIVESDVTSQKNQKQQQKQQSYYCDVLALLENADPSTKYEARVSFSGSPPLRIEMEMVRLVLKSKQSRKLLDTERVQFTTPSELRGWVPHHQRIVPPVPEKKENKKDTSKLLLEQFDGATSLNGNKIRFRVVNDDDGGDATTDNFAVCIRAFEMGVASKSFGPLERAAFVVTVDKMLFGALPYSALPSVCVAAFFVVFGVFAILPKLLKTTGPAKVK